MEHRILANSMRRNRTGPWRVGLLGGFGVGNLGNDASLDAVIRLIRRIDPDAAITCICPKPEVVSARFGIAAHTIRSPRPPGRLPRSPITRLPQRFGDVTRALRIVGSLDALLVPGTGILDDYGGERPTGWPLTLAVWFGAARIRGARTALVSVGAGPLAHRASRRLARLVGRLADHRSFRDIGSREFMISAGLDVPADEVVPDIVFSTPSLESTEPRTDRPLVVVPVMKYRGWYAKQRSALISARHTSSLSEFCSWLLDDGYAVRLVTADEGDDPATDEVAQRIISMNPDLALQWLTKETADDLPALNRQLSDASAVVATRYHSVISALMCGKPTISIGYAAKNDQLMAEVGLGDYCQHIEQIDQALLRRQFKDLILNQRSLSLEVTARVAEFREQLSAEEERIKQRLYHPANLMPLPRSL